MQVAPADAKAFVLQTILAQLKTIDMEQALVFDKPEAALRACLNSRFEYRYVPVVTRCKGQGEYWQLRSVVSEQATLTEDKRSITDGDTYAVSWAQSSACSYRSSRC